MNTDLISNVTTMSSLEIAELTGKNHKDVMRDIRTMLDNLTGANLRSLIESSTYIDPKGESRPMYLLDQDATMTLVSGYNVVLRYKLVKRWRELESGVVSPIVSQTPIQLTQEQIAVRSLGSMLEAYNLLECPKHLAQVESVKYVARTHGVDYSQALLSAPAQNNIQSEDVMLEPTELGKELGCSAIAMNQRLAAMGLQTKVTNGWYPTSAGEGLCTKHAWKRGSKSGYNLKWNLAKIKSLI